MTYYTRARCLVSRTPSATKRLGGLLPRRKSDILKHICKLFSQPSEVSVKPPFSPEREKKLRELSLVVKRLLSEDLYVMSGSVGSRRFLPGRLWDNERQFVHEESSVQLVVFSTAPFGREGRLHSQHSPYTKTQTATTLGDIVTFTHKYFLKCDDVVIPQNDPFIQ